MIIFTTMNTQLDRSLIFPSELLQILSLDSPWIWGKKQRGPTWWHSIHGTIKRPFLTRSIALSGPRESCKKCYDRHQNHCQWQRWPQPQVFQRCLFCPDTGVLSHHSKLEREFISICFKFSLLGLGKTKCSAFYFLYYVLSSKKVNTRYQNIYNDLLLKRWVSSQNQSTP